MRAGDLAGNRDRILAAAREAAAADADLLVTPEMIVSGYPVDDLLGDPDFVDAVRAELRVLAAELPAGLLVAVGAPVPVEDLSAVEQARVQAAFHLDASERSLVNALVLLRDGVVVGHVVKRLLPTYGVFDDARWFASTTTAAPLVSVNGVRVGFAICEDVWSSQVIDELASIGADVIVVANASPFAAGKFDTRAQLLRDHSTRVGLPIVYVNAVGGLDEVVYDGASLAADSGVCTAVLPAFEEGSWTFDVPVDQFVSVDRVRDGFLPAPGITSGVRYPQPLEATYTALVVGLRDYVASSGLAGVIIGLSGGLDSALAAAIAVDALGADRVTGVLMPGPFSSDHSVTDARVLAGNLGIPRVLTLPVGPVVDAELALLGDELSGPGAAVARENIQARARALHVMSLANAHNLLMVNTGNKSEASVGYFTLGGDSSGGFAVLKDVFKTQAYALSRWRNDEALASGAVPPIPVSTLDKPPSAELAPDQVDSGSLPVYPVLDLVLEGLIERLVPRSQIAAELEDRFGPGDWAPVVARVSTLVARAEHKRRQVAPGVKVSGRAFGRDRRVPIANAFTG
jgi:NAD+ synthetase